MADEDVGPGDGMAADEVTGEAADEVVAEAAAEAADAPMPGAGQDALDTVDSIESQLGEVLSSLDGLTGGGESATPFAGLTAGGAGNVDLLRDVQLNVKIELGRCRMYIEDILKLSEGNVVELDKLAGDPVDVFVNDRLVARGEVLVLNDNFCVRIGEIIQPE